MGKQIGPCTELFGQLPEKWLVRRAWPGEVHRKAVMKGERGQPHAAGQGDQVVQQGDAMSHLHLQQHGGHVGHDHDLLGQEALS